jgi:predicted ATPase
MFFEDTHWIDPTSSELLELLAVRVQRLPVLLVITLRPDFQPPWAGLPHLTRLVLGPLGRREAAALVRCTAGKTALPSGVIEKIIKRSEGVPLFLEELTRATIEADWHEGAAGGALIPPPPGDVPRALYSPLMARLDRLGAAREVAQVGAAIGRELPHELIAAVAGRPVPELCAALDRLIEAGLVLRTASRLGPPICSSIRSYRTWPTVPCFGPGDGSCT